MLSHIQRTELLIVSLLPTAATLLVGVIGIEQMQELDVRFFLIVLFASATVFCLEYVLLVFMQQRTRKQIDELVLACRDYLNGNRQRRPDVSGDHALSTLARMLHMLLDAVSQDTQPAFSQAQISANTGHPYKAKKQEQRQQLDTQIQQLIREIMPVTEGDLRVRAETPQGNIGIVAQLFNAFTEEIIELVLWIRYSSSQINNIMQNLESSSIELAQTAETHMLRFSQTTEILETLAVGLEHFPHTLQLSMEITQKVQMHMRQFVSAASFEEKDLWQRLEADTNYQEQLLEEVLNSAQSNAMNANLLVSDFFTFAKCMYESSVTILQAAEQMKSLSALAKQWYTIVTAFQLPVEVEEKILRDSVPRTVSAISR